MYGQGVPFFHAGVELLRSKSLDRDSYNSGDWFNYLDFTYQTNNFGVGLPVAEKNQDNWYLMQPLLANPDLQAGYDDITLTNALFQEMLAVRASSPLFHLETAVDIQERVSFHNVGPAQLPGLIVMVISDKTASDIDPLYESIVVVINSNDETYTFSDADLAGLDLALHPVLANSVDDRVQMTDFDAATGTITVPGRTSAVLVEAEVLTIEQQFDALIAKLQALTDAGEFPGRLGQNLVLRAERAKLAYERGFTTPAVLNLFIVVTVTDAMENAGFLSAADAAEVRDLATGLIAALLE